MASGIATYQAILTRMMAVRAPAAVLKLESLTLNELHELRIYFTGTTPADVSSLYSYLHSCGRGEPAPPVVWPEDRCIETPSPKPKDVPIPPPPPPSPTPVTPEPVACTLPVARSYEWKEAVV